MAIAWEHCSMKINDRGVRVPCFDRDVNPEQIKQIKAICPGIRVETSVRNSSIWGQMIEVCNAWSKEEEIRYKASSGGVISSLAICLLDTKRVDGILHVGQEEDSFLYNKLCVSYTRDDVLKRSSSRYAPAAVFDEIIEILESSEHNYAFIGKPCDIAGLKNLLKEYPKYSNRIKYFLSLFCAGMPSYNATKKILTSFNSKEFPIYLKYRGDGWPGYFTAKYDDGSICRMSYNDSWGKVLGRDLNFRCKICPDGIGLLADISFGDSWKTKDGYPDFSESNGVNFCFVRTLRGQHLMEEAMNLGYLQVENIKEEEIRNIQRYQYIRRQYVGWRYLVVQSFTGNILCFKGLSLLRIMNKVNFVKIVKEIRGTVLRMIKIRNNYAK